MPPTHGSPVFKGEKISPTEEEAASVLGHAAERRRGTVHLLLRTDRGPFRFRLTPADAQQVGSDLRIKAIHPVGERPVDPSAPNEKPGGGIL